MYQNFVTLSPDDIPNDFVKFTDLDMLIDNQQIDEAKPIYLSIDETVKKGRLSEVCIITCDICEDKEKCDKEYKDCKFNPINGG